MANTVTATTLVDGSRVLVVHVHIDGDGSGEELNTVLIDGSTYTPAITNLKLTGIRSNLIGFTAELIWDGTTDVHAWQVPDYEQDQDFKDIGGLPQNATGFTGDVLITTTGLGAGDSGHMILEFRKKS